MTDAILFFVKFPEPGRVKTRLAATVGPVEAARIYRLLVAAVCARLPDDATVIAMFDPPGQREAIIEWLAPMLPPGAHFIPQSEGDLGARLSGAFASAFELGCKKVAAIGSDCAEISAESFSAAWQALETHDVVLGPTDDGGYYLIALAQPIPALFHEIPWSTEQTFGATMHRAQAVGRSVFLLPPLCDVDTEEDWKAASARLSASATSVKTVSG